MPHASLELYDPRNGDVALKIEPLQPNDGLSRVKRFNSLRCIGSSKAAARSAPISGITTPECWVRPLGSPEHGFPLLSGAGRLVVKDAIMMGAALVTMSDSAKARLRKGTAVIGHNHPDRSPRRTGEGLCKLTERTGRPGLWACLRSAITDRTCGYRGRPDRASLR